MGWKRSFTKGKFAAGRPIIEIQSIEKHLTMNFKWIPSRPAD
jgi:hypothetical protein